MTFKEFASHCFKLKGGNINMSDPASILQATILAELTVITAEIERLTGLRSQWNGRVEVEPLTSRAFGGKTFSCLIRIRADIAATDLRWPTLFHEAFHCVSVERSPDASLAYTGYEEGVVEQLQRQFRQELLDRLGVLVASETFIDRDSNSAYNHYIDILEQMRHELGDPTPEFYLRLLGVPLEQRWALLRESIMQTPQWRHPDLRMRWKRWDRLAKGLPVAAHCTRDKADCRNQETHPQCSLRKG